MNDELRIGDKIAYDEQMINATRDRIDKENLLKLKARQEKENNRRKLKIYSVLLCISAGLLVADIAFLLPFYLGKEAPNVFTAMALVGLSVLFPFLALAAGLCCWKFIHYYRRKNKEKDNRDFKWRSYEEMYKIAAENVDNLMQEEMKLITELSVHREIQKTQIEHARLEAENGDAGKYIPLEDIKALEKIEQKEEVKNPFAYSLGGSKGDIEVVTFEQYRDFFYSLQAEYLPDTDSKLLSSYEKEYGSCFLVALCNGEPVGACYGYPRITQDILEEPEFTLQGIAVTVMRQGIGIGSRLLSEFEKRVKRLGYNVIGVGSAPGYVEHFYSKNGYRPVCYKYPDNLGELKIVPIGNDTEYKNIMRKKGGFVVFRKCI